MTWQRVFRLKRAVCEDYVQDLPFRINVKFVSKIRPQDQFCLRLSKKMNYAQMAAAVAKNINVEITKIRFFKSQYGMSYTAYTPITSSTSDTLGEMLNTNPFIDYQLFFQEVSIPINEFENSCLMVVTFVDKNNPSGPGFNLSLLPNMNYLQLTSFVGKPQK